ncbi:hypothetical protein EVAR_78135_1 [Eumeta japonica]|uniref:Uncharacterized protein n=1 Tax=Eumeta variegata TaxID=151549 RepID=A0A4C1T1K9_EUMVA|nr:hypothetical protein EVAR_78135_1 [Eumeta japonica]
MTKKREWSNMRKSGSPELSLTGLQVKSKQYCLQHSRLKRHVKPFVAVIPVIHQSRSITMTSVTQDISGTNPYWASEKTLNTSSSNYNRKIVGGKQTSSKAANTLVTPLRFACQQTVMITDFQYEPTTVVTDTVDTSETGGLMRSPRRETSDLN